MDLATIIGQALAWILIIASIMYGSSLLDFIDVPSVLITVGGTFAATMIHYPLPTLKATWGVMRNSFFVREEDPTALIEALVGYAVRARREGLLALESEANAATDPFLRKGLGLVVDGTDPEMVRSILETDLAFLEERHKAGASMFETMALYAPAFGMIGTLIGLIAMLKNLSDPDSIGPTMSIALLTTLYGSMMANMIFMPIAGKLKVRSAEEILRKELMIEGILAIQAGEGPSIISEKLNSFLAPGQRPTKNKSGRDEE